MTSERPSTADAWGQPWVQRWLPTPFLRASALLHLAAFGLLLARPRSWRLALGMAAADHLALLAASLAPRSPLLGPNLHRLDAAAHRGEVALTFDDGPDPRVTPRVLDLLDAADARASFFLIGRHAAAHPRLTAEIAHRGHRVENHTWSHPHRFAFGGPAGLGREIDAAQGILTELTGRTPAWFRPPAGMRNPLLAGVLARRGLALASWTRRGFDGVSRNPRAVACRLTRSLAAGDVLLLHDGSSLASAAEARDTEPPHAATVLAALPLVLDALSRRGLTGVALPQPPAAGTAPEVTP